MIYDPVWNFNDGMVWLGKDGKYGFANTSGEIVLPFEYYNADSFSEGLACVNKNGKWQYIDKTGAPIISLPDNTYGRRGFFHEGLAAMEKNNKCGYIDKTGTVVIPYIYDYAWDFSEGLAVVQKNGKYGYIDKRGNIIVPLVYDYAGDFNDGLAIVEKEKKYGLLKISYAEHKTEAGSPQTGDFNIVFYVVLITCTLIFIIRCTRKYKI